MQRNDTVETSGRNRFCTGYQTDYKPIFIKLLNYTAYENHRIRSYCRSFQYLPGSLRIRYRKIKNIKYPLFYTRFNLSRVISIRTERLIVHVIPYQINPRQIIEK